MMIAIKIDNLLKKNFILKLKINKLLFLTSKNKDKDDDGKIESPSNIPRQFKS